MTPPLVALAWARATARHAAGSRASAGWVNRHAQGRYHMQGAPHGASCCLSSRCVSCLPLLPSWRLGGALGMSMRMPGSGVWAVARFPPWRPWPTTRACSQADACGVIYLFQGVLVFFFCTQHCHCFLGCAWHGEGCARGWACQGWWVYAFKGPCAFIADCMLFAGPSRATAGPFVGMCALAALGVGACVCTCVCA